MNSGPIVSPRSLSLDIVVPLRVWSASERAVERADLIDQYLSLDGKPARRGGKPTIAINPTWNTERIALQQGAFTLHGSKTFALCRKQATSLVAVPVLKEHKASILYELERVGIGEMFIFPEPEHVCSHLKRKAGL